MAFTELSNKEIEVPLLSSKASNIQLKYSPHLIDKSGVSTMILDRKPGIFKNST